MSYAPAFLSPSSNLVSSVGAQKVWLARVRNSTSHCFADVLEHLDSTRHHTRRLPPTTAPRGFGSLPFIHIPNGSGPFETESALRTAFRCSVRCCWGAPSTSWLHFNIVRPLKGRSTRRAAQSSQLIYPITPSRATCRFLHAPQADSADRADVSIWHQLRNRLSFLSDPFTNFPARFASATLLQMEHGTLQHTCSRSSTFSNSFFDANRSHIHHAHRRKKLFKLQRLPRRRGVQARQ